MNVLIGGDSYGVPSEYVHERLSLAKDLSSLKPPYHIYHHLQQDKHTVHSMALCGTSASYSLHRLEQWLSGEVPERVYVTNKIPDIQTRNISELNNPKISYDLLIYFQPPLMRDFENFNKDMVLQKAVLTHAHTVYKNLARIIEKYQIPKLALIGGAARIMDPYKHYLTPDYFKECWIQDILGTPEPFYAQTMGGLPTYDEMIPYSSVDYIDEVMRNDEYLKGAIFEHPGFPDDAHPGGPEHAELYNDLKLLFNL